jgi:hypothetical protein
VDTSQIIEIATQHLQSLQNHVFDVLTVEKPVSPAAAINLSKVISKLSPFLGNLIEFNTVAILNDLKELHPFGSWMRQDPGFPDAIFQGSVKPVPGFEIKAWFPLATEITARFKDSQSHFINANTYVALLAWLPEYVIYGKPKILGVCVMEGGSIAHARDQHYHKPPYYLVLEPEDTTLRSVNLQQTNTSGYVWQGTKEDLKNAQTLVDSWGLDGNIYRPTVEYQSLLRQLTTRYSYRLDTNFAKIDRIVHPEIEKFKKFIFTLPFQGLTVGAWLKICSSKKEAPVVDAFRRYLGIIEDEADRLVQ